MTKKFKTSILLFLILTPTFLWMIYLNIDHIAWISYIRASVYIESDSSQVSYKLYPSFTIAATNKDLLTIISNFIDNYQSQNTATVNGVSIKLDFNNDGFDYGGLVVSPGLIIRYSRANGSTTYESHFWTFLDIREYCGDTPKNGICSYNNPFKGFTNLTFALSFYFLICATLIFIIVLMPMQSHRKVAHISG